MFPHLEHFCHCYATVSVDVVNVVCVCVSSQSFLAATKSTLPTLPYRFESWVPPQTAKADELPNPSIARGQRMQQKCSKLKKQHPQNAYLD